MVQMALMESSLSNWDKQLLGSPGAITSMQRLLTGPFKRLLTDGEQAHRWHAYSSMSQAARREADAALPAVQVVQNPNAEGSCGCGSSFNPKGM